MSLFVNKLLEVSILPIGCRKVKALLSNLAFHLLRNLNGEFHMDLSSIINKEAELTADVFRNYLQIKLQNKYPGTSWKGPLFARFKQKQYSNYGDTYKKALSRIEELGEENYSLNNMDITLLSAVLCFDLENALGLPVKAGILSAIKRLRDDKNDMASHREMGEDEPIYDKLYFAIVWHKDIKRFLNEIEREMERGANKSEETTLLLNALFNRAKEIDELIRAHFSTPENSEVVDHALMLLLQKDVNQVLDASDCPSKQRHLYLRFLDKYKYVNFGPNLSFLFWKMLADGGYLDAALSTARSYYDGYYRSGSSVPDYESASYYFQLAGEERLMIYDKCMLASIYINEASAHHTKKEGEVLLDECRTFLSGQGRAVLSHVDENGFTHYRPER